VCPENGAAGSNDAWIFDIVVYPGFYSAFFIKRGSMTLKISIAAIIGLAALGGLYSNLRAQSARSVWDGVYTQDQAKQGQAFYGESCSSCHGDTLMGGESAPALAGGEFLSNWNGLTLGDLFDRIRTTMPQNRPGSLSREKNAAILAYMLSVSQFPAGKSALPQQSEVLKEIKIDASKPEK
jgi:S-disulfanyl-L-cysteine oxidoreductase SoxD